MADVQIPGAETTAAPTMPYTAMILESEQKQREANPDAPQERPEHHQFIMDQEAAVQRDFDAGRISKEDYDSFRELGTARVEEIRAEVGVEVEEFGADAKETFAPYKDELKEEIGQFKDVTEKYGAEMENLTNLAKNNQLDAGDVPLGMAADIIDPVLDVSETALDITGDAVGLVEEHIPEIVDVAVDNTQETAHEFVNARAEMQGVDQAEIAAARGQLEQLDAGLVEKIDEFNEKFDASMENAGDYVDWNREQIDAARDTVDDMRDYAEEHPDATVEDYPGAVQQPVDSSEDMGVAEA